MLQLRIGFPTGRYLAASLDDPRQPEWPPHPSRVFSALVAAAYAGGRQPSEAERALLHLVESAPAPGLDFPDADVRPAPDSYVPVNDEDSRIRARKLQSHGVLWPNRQVRQFPSAFMLHEPEVSIRWPVEVTAPELDVLDGLAARITHVGTSHSFVTACFGTGPAACPPRWVPRDDGVHYLRVARAGRLDELDRLVGAGHGTLRRPAPLFETLIPYGESALAPQSRPPPYDWVCLRVRDASWGADTAHTLGRALRRAVMALLGDDAPAEVHGHDASLPHVAWLPLPDVGHPHARGKVMGLAVALPMAMAPAQRAVAMAGLARLQLLHLPDGQTASLAPAVDGPETPVALRAATWAAVSTHWSTVTPVLLDRPPKRHDDALIEAAMAQSLELAGFPRPVTVSVGRHSDFDGAPDALDVPTRMPRFHARVSFPAPVTGPVIAGRWKNFGIGLFRPTPMELRS